MRASSIARVFDRLWPLFHKDPLEIFPAEIMSLILSRLGPQDLITLSLVSRAWRERVTDGNLWKEKFSMEGWGLNSKQIESYEEQFKQEESMLQPSRSGAEAPNLHFSLNAFGKQRASSDDYPMLSVPREITNGAEQHWSDLNLSNHNTGHRSHSADQEMTDAYSEHSSSFLQTTTTGGFEPNLPPYLSQFRFSKTAAANRHRLSLEKPLMVSAHHQARMNYQYMYKQKRRLEDNWDKGRYKNFQLPHRNFPNEAHEECVYTIQYQGDYLVSGSRDRTVRIWNLNSGRLAQRPLKAHVGSVLCLQFDSRPEENIIISGSSDTHVILWRFSTGKIIRKILNAHKESVLNLRFDHRFLITCSKDKTIKIWNRHELRPGDVNYPVKGVKGGGECPSYILDTPSIGSSIRYQPSSPEHLMLLTPYMHLMTLDLHNAAVNAIQIYEDQLVSASGDRNLRIWNIHTGECYSKIQAHEKGIACVQYDGKRIVSGSSDNSIRIWDPVTRTQVARLEGHVRLVRTLQAAFSDAPGGRNRLEAEAQEVDRAWHIAKNKGEDLRTNRPGRPARPGSRRPRDVMTVGAKIPPSGGGSRWARIISGSYDEKIIIWKKNADDEWVISHQLAQEEALTAAGPPLPTRSQAHGNAQTSPPPLAHLPQVTPTNAIGNTPHTDDMDTRTLDVDPSRIPQSSRQSSSSRNLSSRSVRPVTDLNAASGSSQSSSRSTPAPAPPHQSTVLDATQDLNNLSTQTNTLQSDAPSNPTNGQGPGNVHQNNTNPRPHPALNGAPPAGQPNARVFKLQFDARRIICCSQDNKIVGWDFANGDEDIISCSRFFADPQ